MVFKDENCPPSKMLCIMTASSGDATFYSESLYEEGQEIGRFKKYAREDITLDVQGNLFHEKRFTSE